MKMITKKAFVSLSIVSNRSVGKPSCRTCGGTGWEVVHFRKTDLARRCRCRTERNEKFWMETVGIPAKLCRCDLRDYFDRRFLSAGIEQKIQRYVSRFPEVPGTLFLIGDQGRTAAQVAVGLLKEIQRIRKSKVRFIDCKSPSVPNTRDLFDLGDDQDAFYDGESADLVVFDHLLDPDIDVSLQMQWIGLLHRRYLAQRHNILNCDALGLRLLRASFRGRTTGLALEVVQILKGLATDGMWCCLFPQGRHAAVASPSRPHGAVA